MTLYCVPPSHVGQVWPQAREFIRRAMEKVDFSPFADVERDVLNGHALLWFYYGDEKILAAAVTQVHDKICTIVANGGSGRGDWLHSIEKIQEYARSMGCERMRIIGRRGWARVLKDYRQTAIVLERKL